MTDIPCWLREAVDDWHTHTPGARRAIINLPSVSAPAGAGLLYSAGIHPWDAAGVDEALFEALHERLATDPSVVAVGEAGLDRRRGPSLDVQLPVFERQARMADECGKPLIIHCVRAVPEIVALHKRLRPAVPWIVHGFRGGREAALQLLARPGIFISLGHRFNPEAAAVIPPSRLLRESDTDGALPGAVSRDS